MEIFRNFPEKYEIFWTNFPPHITSGHWGACLTQVVGHIYCGL